MPVKPTPPALARLRNTHWTPATARTVLAKQAASGETLAAFARRHGLLPQRLFWWRKRLVEAQPAAPLFVPAVITGTPLPLRASPRPPQVTVRLGDLEVDLHDTTVSPEWLAALLCALRAQR